MKVPSNTKKSDNSKKLKGLYIISDDLLTPKNTLLENIEQVLKAGASIIQLRDKTSSDEDIENLVVNLEKLCKKYDALFVLNDRVNLAIKLQCQGLHIGKSDYERIDFIRENFKGIVGVSCYDDVNFAKTMEEKGIDYVAFGSFFASLTKPHSKVVNKEVLENAKELLNIPVCAIGGITSNNAYELIKYKTDMLAVISDIWKANNKKEKCEEYIKQFKEKQ